MLQRYSITSPDGFSTRWAVWDVLHLVRLSEHDSEREAKAAVKRYEAADKRGEG